MTVTYINTFATSTYWTFLRLLIRWKGSIYKIIWFELLIFSIFYAALSCLYRFGLTGSNKSQFEDFCRFCKTNAEIIPVPFVLGFYVTLVVSRWWGLFTALPWPDTISLYVASFITGRTEKAAMYRRSIVRYLNLSYCMVLASISSKARRIFPDLTALKSNELLTDEEESILKDFDNENNKYFVPVTWANKLVHQASLEKMTTGDRGVESLTEEINRFRGSLGTVFAYDWINPPLVYTQIATISVHVYFIIFVLSEQFIPDTKLDMYVPVFGFLQFVFYMGWLKVAESLINPFGDDDDDFEIDEIIYRNIKMSYLILDTMHDSQPWLENMVKSSVLNVPQPSTIIDNEGTNKEMFAGSLLNLNDNALIGSKLSIFSNNMLTSINRLNRGSSRRRETAVEAV